MPSPFNKGRMKTLLAWAKLNALFTRAAIPTRLDAMGFKQLQMERLPNLCLGPGAWVWVVLWQTIWKKQCMHYSNGTCR